MNLRIRIHPSHKLEYTITGPDHYVVGGTRWLMRKNDLPRIWGHSRFLTEADAKKFLASLSENDVVTMEDVKQVSKQVGWYSER